MGPEQTPFPASLPRPLRIVAVALLALLLTGFFVYLGFPYDALATRLASRVEQATGLQIRHGPVRASPQLLGPGIAIEDVRARTAGGGAVALERVVLRPAWSLSWLTGEPSIHLDAESVLGRLRGVLRVSEEPAFAGQASELDLAALLRAASVETGLTGSAELDADVLLAAAGAEGPLRIRARDGVLSHPSLPLDVPYETLEGDFALGGDATAQIRSLEIVSPLGTGRITGSIGRARALAQSPLALDVEIVAAEDVQPMLRSQRIPVDAEGRIRLTLRGTLAQPVVR